jgi:hypothetical protein
MLFLAWRINADRDSASRAGARLAAGERRGFFSVHSFSATQTEARAYLEPLRELETILESVCYDPADLVSSRWIDSRTTFLSTADPQIARHSYFVKLEGAWKIE